MGEEKINKADKKQLVRLKGSNSKKGAEFGVFEEKGALKVSFNAVVWNEMIFKVLCNPNSSLILSSCAIFPSNKKVGRLCEKFMGNS